MAYDDRTKELLLKQAGTRGALLWNLQDAEEVISALLKDLDDAKAKSSAVPMKASFAFVEWTKEHPGDWKLGAMFSQGKFSHFVDPETDSAWMGFEAAWKIRSEMEALPK